MASVTFVRGSETTEQGATQTGITEPARRVRDVSKDIAYLDPDAAPFTVLMLKAASRPAVNPMFEWVEKQLATKWTYLTTNYVHVAAYTTAQTLAVADNIFEVDDVILAVATGEYMRVESYNVGGSTITVTRNIAGTGGFNSATGVDSALANAADLVIIGSSAAEGSGAPKERTWNESWLYNFTEIFKDAFGVTGTEDASELYTGKDRPRLRLEKGIDHKLNLERSFLYGIRYQDNQGSGATVRRYSGGLVNQWLTSNITNAGGILTEPTAEQWLEAVFAHVGATDTRLFACAPRVVSVIDQIAAARLEVVPDDKTYGITVRQWITSHGTLNIVKHRLLENTPQGSGSGTGFGNLGLAIDTSKIMMRPLNGRQTQLQTDLQLPDADAWKDQYMTEAGWEVHLPQVHGVLSNVTG